MVNSEREFDTQKMVANWDNCAQIAEILVTPISWFQKRQGPAAWWYSDSHRFEPGSSSAHRVYTQI